MSTRIDRACRRCTRALFALLTCDAASETAVSADWGLLEMRGDKSENKSDDGVRRDTLSVSDDADQPFVLDVELGEPQVLTPGLVGGLLLVPAVKNDICTCSTTFSNALAHPSVIGMVIEVPSVKLTAMVERGRENVTSSMMIAIQLELSPKRTLGHSMPSWRQRLRCESRAGGSGREHELHIPNVNTRLSNDDRMTYV